MLFEPSQWTARNLWVFQELGWLAAEIACLVYDLNIFIKKIIKKTFPSGGRDFKMKFSGAFFSGVREINLISQHNRKRFPSLCVPIFGSVARVSGSIDGRCNRIESDSEFIVGEFMENIWANGSHFV